MKKLLFYLPILLLSILFETECSTYAAITQGNQVITENRVAEDIKITILYDNYTANSNTRSDWGFACLIEGLEKTVLFDTGADGGILLENIDKLGVDIAKIDLIFISHAHDDHTGGVKSVMLRKPDLPVYVTNSFPKDFGSYMGIKNVIHVSGEKEICKNALSTGEMGIQIHEQSLIIKTCKGLVIVTGCSHQGIVNILEKASDVNKEIFFVFGGFHLLRDSKSKVEEIISQFKRFGVQKCGATHCTGDSQIQQFKDAYKENYVEMGVGRIIKISKDGLAII